MIDTAKEVTYPIQILVKKLPVPRSQRTVRRWIQDGCRINGVVICMEWVLVGGTIYSSVEAYHRWIVKCTKAKAKA
jgi:hypothetical protein